MPRKKKFSISRVADFVFLVFYIVLTIITILDLFGVSLPVVNVITSDSTLLMRFIILVFSSIGIVVLSDKRESQKKIQQPIERIEKTIISPRSNTGIRLFTNKDEFYLYFTQLLRELNSGSEILLTAFEKNQNVNYYTGENKHIEAFMDDWKAKVTSNAINVRHILHICTKKEYAELEERLDQFKNCFNYSAGVMIGFPIRPFIEFAIVNKELVMLGFANDKTAPYEEAFTVVIKDSELASNLEKFFNIYWNTDCLIVKSRDGINRDNLTTIDMLTCDDMPSLNPIDINCQSLKAYSITKQFDSFSSLLNDLYLLLPETLAVPRACANAKIEKAKTDIHKIITDSVKVKPSNVYKTMTHILHNAHSRIMATSIEIGNNTFWTSDVGEEIFDLNIKSISEKGVKVNRVFITTSDQREATDLIVNKQISAGVTTSVVEITKERKEDYKDFVIVDNCIVMEVFESGEARLYVGKEMIEKYIKNFTVYSQQGIAH